MLGVTFRRQFFICWRSLTNIVNLTEKFVIPTKRLSENDMTIILVIMKGENKTIDMNLVKKLILTFLTNSIDL